MKPYTRKLFLYYDPPYSTTTSLTPPHLPTTTNATSSPPSSSKTLPQHNPAFDSSMALTVVVLLTALFFMGFFSIYLRRLSDDPTAHLSRRRRYRGGPLESFTFPSDLHRVSASRKGIDPTTIRSLPVYSYHGNAKYQRDCAICLSEFEEKEFVKTIPYCKHVFHVECIDKWLASHVSCPVCRGTRLFEIKDGGGGCGLGVVQERIDHGVSWSYTVEISGSSGLGGMQERIDQGVSQSSTVDISVSNGLGVMQERIDQGVSQSSTVESDTCMLMMGTTSGMRRTSSCSSLGQQAMLQRTLSF